MHFTHVNHPHGCVDAASSTPAGVRVHVRMRVRVWGGRGVGGVRVCVRACVCVGNPESKGISREPVDA